MAALESWLIGCAAAAPAGADLQARGDRLDRYAAWLEREAAGDPGAQLGALRARVAPLRDSLSALAGALDGWDARQVQHVRMLVQGTVDEVNFRATLEEAPLGVLRYAATLAVATGHKSRITSIGRAIARREQAAAA